VAAQLAASQEELSSISNLTALYEEPFLIQMALFDLSFVLCLGLIEQVWIKIIYSQQILAYN
jgi:ATP/ADP translocase